jgi:divalent metal cation (Fe/Co/Zn/Cd) transporter
MFGTIFFLVLAAGLLWTTYANLMLGSYENAFRVSMTALALSIATLTDFLYFFMSELARRLKSKTTSNDN